jgi:hypothetical protein
METPEFPGEKLLSGSMPEVITKVGVRYRPDLPVARASRALRKLRPSRNSQI